MFLYICVALLVLSAAGLAYMINLLQQQSHHIDVLRSELSEEILEKVRYKAQAIEYAQDLTLEMEHSRSRLQYIGQLEERLETATDFSERTKAAYEALEKGMDEMQEGFEQELLTAHEQLEAAITAYNRIKTKFEDYMTQE